MKKLLNKKASASIEIVLLILASFAFAYFVHESDSSIEKIDEEAGKEYEKLGEQKLELQEQSLISSLGEYFLKKLKKPMLPLVKAQVDLSVKCCELTKNNEPCVNIIDENECETDPIPTSCESTSFCRLGCCIDEYEGTYDKSVPQSLCTGRWEDDKNCNVPGARFGCCVLGNTIAYVTDTRCSRLSESFGLEKDYRSNLNEEQCVALTMMQEIGACVLSGGNCEFVTGQQCASLTGNLQNFHKGYLCTAPALNTGCEKTDKTTCVDNKDGVYFLDSCGNPANIYDVSRYDDASYWNAVAPIGNNCNPGSGNADSKTCGNCNRFLGGICASAAEDNFDVNMGDFYCRDTSCEYQGDRYGNGESWCVYDGKIDDGNDVVGSRHWKYVCSQGKIQIEPCADYRNQICVQHNTILDEGTGETFANANCRMNNWRKCLIFNTEEREISECEEELDCMVYSLYVDKYFKGDMCVPKYPAGFSLNDQEDAEMTCGMASRTCTMYFVKEVRESDLKARWYCEENCACGTTTFTQQMNDLCRSLGDCGGYVNIEGEVTSSGYTVSSGYKANGKKVRRRDIHINLDQYEDNANPVAGQYAEVGDILEYLQSSGLVGVPGDLGYEEGEDWLPDAAAWGAGVAGVTYALAYLSWSSAVGAAASISELTGLAAGGANPAVWGSGFVSVVLSIGTAVVLALWFSDLAGIEGQAAEWAVYTAVAATAIILIWTEAGGAVAGFWGAIIGVAIGAILYYVFRVGDTKEKTVTFTCKPWQPPIGGDDCEECNNNPLKPCSEYRCRSLGAACELINKGTTQEMCVDSNPDDVWPPVISPQLGTIAQNAKYTEITDEGFKIESLEEECLDAYTSLTFGINTDEPAHCKYDLEMKDFDEMGSDVGTNAHVYNHTVNNFMLPDPSHGQSQGLDWTGDITLYIKCVDTHGNENKIPSFYTIEMCIKQGPDATPPIIQRTEPENNALISYNATFKQVKIYTNEPANCSWSLGDKDYSLMENPMDCENYLMGMTIFGYMCNSSLPINSSENAFYFRCKDQPWLEGTENSSERNANLESLTYVLRKPENPLTIDWIEPSEDFEVATSPATVAVKVQTSGGGQNPKCSYSFSGYDRMVTFFSTFSDLHEQEFNLVSGMGRHKIYIECEDEIGDKVQGETEFTIIHDNIVPQVVRIYVQDGSLNIITNEDAECVYTTESCIYDFADGTDISGTEKEHSVTVMKGKTYYIKCRDSFGNLPDSGGCSTTVAYV